MRDLVFIMHIISSAFKPHQLNQFPITTFSWLHVFGQFSTAENFTAMLKIKQSYSTEADLY